MDCSCTHVSLCCCPPNQCTCTEAKGAIAATAGLVVTAIGGIGLGKGMPAALAWTFAVGGGVVSIGGFAVACVVRYRHRLYDRIPEPNAEEIAEQGRPIFWNFTAKPSSSTHLPPLPSTDLAITALPSGHLLTHSPEDQLEREKFYQEVSKLKNCIIFAPGSDQISLPQTHTFEEERVGPLHLVHIYETFEQEVLGKKRRSKRFLLTSVLFPIDDVYSIVSACQCLHEKMEREYKPILICPDGVSENVTFLACYLMNTLFKSGQNAHTCNATEEISREYPAAKPNRETITNFACFLDNLPHRIKRWYCADLILPTSPFYADHTQDELQRDFQSVVDKEYMSNTTEREIRSCDGAWLSRSRCRDYVPYQENELHLSSGAIFNASTLPFGFIATQIPIPSNTKVNKFETVPEYLQMLKETNAKVVVAIGADPSNPPPCPGVQVVRLDAWKSKQPYSLEKIYDAILLVESLREDKPVVVMCSNGSILTCTYIACHIAYQVYQDVKGRPFQLSLQNLHHLLRLPPHGRYGAINYTANYHFIDCFIKHLLAMQK